MLSLEKCCFCVPRRLGLLIIVFLRMIILISALCYIITCMVRSEPEQKGGAGFVPEISSILFIVVDMIFCGILIMAIKKSHLKLYKLFFNHSILVIFFTITSAIVYFNTWNQMAITEEGVSKEIPSKQIVGSSVVVILLTQLYIILLVRSEMVKVKNTQYWNPRTGHNMLL